MISTWVSRYVQNVTATLFIEVILTKHILVFLSCGNLHVIAAVYRGDTY